ncbi:monovalent cation/H+ antiporter subunit A [Methylotenera sp. L2L1]|uniref:monovalent cation/H+ antiporter subunit A n=1 Tax=Methylotenera sp. L2L1 TaxID=1502770 RepID=UPI000AC7CDD9|nr:monovalent cation/H+ antiporter subunit A [Methylotenera sp. L2L1]
MIESAYLPTLLPLALFVAFSGVALPLIVEQHGRKSTAIAAGAVMAICLGLLAPLFPIAMSGQSVIAHFDWLPNVGLNLSFRLDGLGMLFSMLILGIGMLVVLYAHYYLPSDDKLGRFYALLLLFMSAMLGIVLSENLLMMVVFWEVTSLSSFLLIAYKSASHESRIAARMALVVTGVGGLALFAGVLLLGKVAGSYELTDVIVAVAQIKSDPLYPTILTLVLLGAFTKSAQFPFQFWLPNAMVAPTPVSAYLHSATMVKAGVFLLARFYPVLSGTDAWLFSVSTVGGITLVYGAYLAMYRNDFKGLLAYSTISHLGLITLLFGLSTPMSVVAAVFHIINHAIFKASLFMAAGIIDHECGSRDMRRVNGLFKLMPITATLAMLAAGSMAGVPLLNGFLSKEMFFTESIVFHGFGGSPWILPIFATIAGVLAVAYSARFIHDVFFNGQPVDLPRQPHEPPRWMRVPMEILVVLCLLVGIFPAWSVGALLAAAAGASLQSALPVYDLKIWHGFNLAFLMSLIALAGGVGLYMMRSTLVHWNNQLPTLSSRMLFERAYQGLAAYAENIMLTIDNGSLQRYIAVFFVFVLVYGSWAFISGGRLDNTVSTMPLDIASVIALSALVLGALGATFMHHRRLLSIILIGVVGLVVVLVFVRFSAPDLALTQLSIEVVTTVLMLLALHYLPQSTPRESSRIRVGRDVLLALAIGLGMAFVSFELLTSSFSTISDFYLQQSVPGGGGSNVVNVILVDFRGFDTLGEITVLAMAALGTHALLNQLRLLQPMHDSAGRLWAADAHPLFLKMLMRPLLPLALAVAVYLFLRGHHMPGGGFVAGLVTGVALILQSLAGGFSFAEDRLPKSYSPILGLGLALAAGVGLLSWFFVRPFLTSAHGHIEIPLVGDIALASVIIFDLGVYLVVVATVLLILTELGRINVRGGSV